MDDVIVIGGGPSGMIAAYAAARRGLRVRLLEKNEKLGKKLFITGKGRCNLTNACEAEGFFAAQRRNPKFLYSSFSRFSNLDLMDLIESAGCPLKTERGERVFPLSDHSSDVIRALSSLLKEAGVKVKLLVRVSEIARSNEGFICKSSDGLYPARSVIVATGGLSYPLTGSAGDGYAFAKSFGIKIIPLSPSLCSLKVAKAEAEECERLSGLTLKNVGLELWQGKKELYSGRGELLFTHTGLSGPLSLSASSFLNTGDGAEGELSAHIDLKPALSKETLDKRMLREIGLSPAKEVKNLMRRLVPASLIPSVTVRGGVDPFKKAGELRREERMRLADTLKDLSFHVTGTGGFDEAIVTRGGVDVSELDPRTMESKRVRGLFFAGEVIDIDALTGGFNLQNAFSTGFQAGSSVCPD